MPTYTYHCDTCDTPFEKTLRMSQSGDPQDCPECGKGPARKTITGMNFILKGDGWAGKNNRIAGQMRRKNQRLDAKQAEMKRDAPSVTLAPNVDGERVDSWSDASKLAKSKGKDTSGYEKRAKVEKKAD
jgi:putative FmdB family regulatory protein